MASRVVTAASSYARSLSAEGALHPDDPAVYAIIDFQRDYPITVEADCSVDEALADMVQLRLHALLVTRQEPGGMEQRILGLVTAQALERNIRWRGRCKQRYSERPGDAPVVGAMTPWNELPLLKYESLVPRTAIELYEMFRGTGLTHVLIAESQHEQAAFVRGLVSRASLARRLRRHHAAAAR